LPCKNHAETGGTSCYYPGGSKATLWLGVGLIAIGLIVIFLCVPFWAWLLIAATILILLGFWLIRK